MAVRLADHVFGALGTLRFEPTPMRVRGLLRGRTAVDTTRALLVWEPRRVVPQYAVPVADVLAELVPAAADAGPRHGPAQEQLGERTVLTPATGFGVHSTDGEPMTLRMEEDERPGAAFRPADPDLEGYVVLDFAALDWHEEDSPVLGHPRDPFHRIDVRRSSRQVRIELDGTVLAESWRPSLLVETSLPVMRYYLPPEDVRRELLRPSTTETACAYKGVATYWSVGLPDRTVPDLVWSYPKPLPGAEQVAGLMCFFAERVDVVVDGVLTERPQTPWS